jgi:hypothetical protein
MKKITKKISKPIPKTVAWLLILNHSELIIQENIPNICMSHAVVCELNNIDALQITDTGIEYEDGTVWFRRMGWI